MATIEKFGAQMDDIITFNTDTILAYKKVVPYACHCGKHEDDYVKDFGEWQPVLDCNHTWQVVTLLENFGYTGYDYDTFLYTFYVTCPKCKDHDDITYKGDGLNFGQAVCNALIKFSENR